MSFGTFLEKSDGSKMFAQKYPSTIRMFYFMDPPFYDFLSENHSFDLVQYSNRLQLRLNHDLLLDTALRQSEISFIHVIRKIQVTCSGVILQYLHKQ